MLFNSITFLLFFALVYSVYLLLKHHPRWQNAMLLVASYVFYGYWDWRFLGLLAASTVVDFICARRIEASSDTAVRKRWLWLSVGVNLGVLGFFKYANFFVESAAELLRSVGMQPHLPTLQIVLPVGISFYTFQTMSYTIDVYRRHMKSAAGFLDFALYVAFFPQLVAGPIERATHLLPQFAEKRRITSPAVQLGVFLILWGYFKKVVIADNVAPIADAVFNQPQDYAGLDTTLAVVAFTLQIYCDFSGYSDIARGIAKLLGFDLMVNFRLPYFAISPSDFWRRWHISLSSWLRDYLYIPLGGNRGGVWRTHRNLFLTMLLGGLWHGAAWNFVLWGAYHGALLILFRVAGFRDAHPPPHDVSWSAVRMLPRMMVMFVLTMLGWILFRCSTFDQIVTMLTHVGWQVSPHTAAFTSDLLWFGTPLLAMQAAQYKSHDLSVPLRLPALLLGVFYGLLLLSIVVFGVRDASEFIYFQF